jgi:outer membrane lipoprotein SlyB
MRPSLVSLVSASLFLSSFTLQADVVKLKDGRAIQGIFLGGNTRQIDFLSPGGQTLNFPLTSVASVAFSALPGASGGGGAPGGGTPAAPTASAAPAARPAVLIPAGTSLRVRTIDNIDVDSSAAGAKYRASLDDPIMVGGAVVIPKGADAMLQAVKVQQSGKMKGSDLIQLKVIAVSVGGTSYPVVTSIAESKGKSEGKATARKTLGGAGLGALVGGIAGGGKGALIGTAAGAAGGAIVSASGQQHLKIPPETRLEFKMESDLKV